MARFLIWCFGWIQVHSSKKEQLLEAVLEQWGPRQGSGCHVVTSQRRDVPNVATSQHHDVESTMQKSTSGNVVTFQRRDVSTSRRLNVATFQRRDVSSRSAPHHLKYEWLRNWGHREEYERRHVIPEQSDTDFEEVPEICTVFHFLDIFGY